MTFFFNIFYLQLIESIHVKPMNMEDQLYIPLYIKKEDRKKEKHQNTHMVNVNTGCLGALRLWVTSIAFPKSVPSFQIPCITYQVTVTFHLCFYRASDLVSPQWVFTHHMESRRIFFQCKPGAHGEKMAHGHQLLAPSEKPNPGYSQVANVERNEY